MFVYFVHVVLIHVDLKQVLLSWVINIEILVDLHFKEFQIQLFFFILPEILIYIIEWLTYVFTGFALLI